MYLSLFSIFLLTRNGFSAAALEDCLWGLDAGDREDHVSRRIIIFFFDLIFSCSDKFSEAEKDIPMKIHIKAKHSNLRYRITYYGVFSQLIFMYSYNHFGTGIATPAAFGPSEETQPLGPKEVYVQYKPNITF